MDFHESVASFDDDDLSLVAPHRRAEVRRRLQAVKRYDAKPTLTEGKAAAAAAGISLQTLYALVRTWRRTGQPADLLGSGRPKKRRDELGADRKRIIEEAVEAIGGSDVEAIVDRVIEGANAKSVPMFGRQVLRKHVRNVLGSRVPEGSFAQDAPYAIDHVAIDLPVLFQDGTVAMPILTTLIDLRRPAVLAVDLHPGHPDMAATAWTAVAAFEGGFPKPGDALAYEEYPGEDWKRLGNAMRDLGVDLRVAPRAKPGRTSIAVEVLGDRYRGIWLKPRSTLKPLKDRKSTALPANVAIERDEAVEILRGRWMEAPTDFRSPTSREATVVNRLRELPVNRWLYV